jgi:mono/diheme cytochrome c family protein
MKKFLKWTLSVIGILFVFAFLGFLYFIPPFTLAPPEEFIKPEREATPTADQIADPAERAIAEHGRYLVLTIGCTGCHTAGGDKGPKFDTGFLAGGRKFTYPGYGTVVSRNLTPDPNTGLARRTTADVMRTLRSGVSPDDGRVFFPYLMPWAEFSHMTEEDRYAVATYLKHLKSVHHEIPPFTPVAEFDAFAFYGMDYGIDEQK